MGALERGSDPGYADFKTPVLHLSGIPAISKYAFDGWKQSRPTQQLEGSVTVLDIGGMNNHA